MKLWTAHSRRLQILNRLHAQIMGHVVKIYGKGEPDLEDFLRNIATQVYGRIAFENTTAPEHGHLTKPKGPQRVARQRPPTTRRQPP